MSKKNAKIQFVRELSHQLDSYTDDLCEVANQAPDRVLKRIAEQTIVSLGQSILILREYQKDLEEGGDK